MLPRAHRLSRSLFPELQKSRKFKNTEHFSLKIAPSPKEGVHIAVSVSKRVAKSAVVRNRIRRRAYAAIYPKLGTVRPGLYLFIAKPKVQDISGDALNHEIDLLLNNVF
jgi:ribonuclease P protein component